MSELLFQNTYIAWVGGWISSFLVSVGIGLVVIGILLWKEKIKNRIPPKKITPYIPIHPENPHYIEETLAGLKKYLLNRYAPHHVTAHTAEEIAHYIEESEFASLIESLETALYRGETWDSEKTTNTNTQILTLITSDIAK